MLNYSNSTNDVTALRMESATKFYLGDQKRWEKEEKGEKCDKRA